MGLTSLSSKELSSCIMGVTPLVLRELVKDYESICFKKTRKDFQVIELSLASSKSFWLYEPRAKRKD